jgi:hypothetical protein
MRPARAGLGRLPHQATARAGLGPLAPGSARSLTKRLLAPGTALLVPEWRLAGGRSIRSFAPCASDCRADARGSKEEPSVVLIMGAATETQVVDRVLATDRPGLDMIELQ